MDVISLPKREFMMVTENLPEARRRFKEGMEKRERATKLTLGQRSETGVMPVRQSGR